MDEKKAFDLKDLEAKLKEKGLPQVEGLAKAAAEAVFEWIEEGVGLSPTKLDDLALVLLPSLKSMVMSKIDEIAP